MSAAAPRSAGTGVPIRVAVRFAVAVAVFLIAANAPYAWLIANFGYDDVLREPAGAILVRFSQGGAPLVLAWLAFSIGALLFVPVVLEFRRLFGAQSVDSGSAAVLGLGAAFAQAAGLLRWVLVVPALAAAYTDPSADLHTRQVLLITFESVHRFGGAVVGEMLGQILLAGWTAMTVIQLAHTKLVPTWLVWMGGVTPPLWILGQSELLHDVVPAIPSIEVTPVAFMLWESWLALLAVTIVWRAIGAARQSNSKPATQLAGCFAERGNCNSEMPS
jgi:hypothetical protein